MATKPKFRGLVAVAVVCGAVFCGARPAMAVPSLQLYLQGGTYDNTTETWVANAANNSVRLWVVGTPGTQGAITDTKLVAAYGSANGAGNVQFSITPSTTGDLGGFADPSTPASIVALGENTSQTNPLMNSGLALEPPEKSLPSHGIYGTGTFFQEFSIGDFSSLDSPTADFVTSFPTPSSTDGSQINVYDISFTGVTTGWVHFDVFGTQSGKDVFAPFSHDAQATTGLTSSSGGTPIPEPGQTLLFGLALLAAGLYRQRRRR